MLGGATSVMNFPPGAIELGYDSAFALQIRFIRALNHAPVSLIETLVWVCAPWLACRKAHGGLPFTRQL